MMRTIRRLLIGKPLHNNELAHEKLPKWKALSIFSSDALSSVAYGPEQIILTLVAVPGLIAYSYMAPISLSILVLLAIVALSYVQVAKANPGGGGAYAVAKKNLGEMPALIAAGSVFADYVLTAAVSVTAGTAAITSAFPFIAGHDVAIDLFVLFAILMLINLRGVRESSNAFVFPTYAFLFGILCLVAVGAYKAFTESTYLVHPDAFSTQPLNWAAFFVILRAFANGCSSMTGVEAIADSVPMFRKPESHNATITTYWMAGILGTMFTGISFLMLHYHIIPIPDVTALSQIAEQVFGRGWFYYYIQLSTMLVLYLAANTAYNGLPILLSIVAKDGYMPRYLATRGERLTYSNGILLLTIAAATLIVVFGGNIDHLISLYAIGVFVSFTIAQTSMIVHWRRERGQGWQLRAWLNGLGAFTTGLVVIIITVTKFAHGAWLILVFVPSIIFVFKKIRGHYDSIAKQLSMPPEFVAQAKPKAGTESKHIVVVPVSTPTRVVFETLKYAKAIGDNVLAVHVASEEDSEEKIKAKWNQWDLGLELVVLHSPYRLLMNPLIDYIEHLHDAKGPDDYITVVIPEFETKRWWHRLLHNQTGWILRTALILRENVIVTTVPYQLKE
ncbi:APC family permease [Dendrosporobacter sp. 1207_IL3150]|uniref:APC family permease n=1 Tax=Dendrosporobacter sp. 1207_IL3150 TaxID=3084054 RepID=UPI002FD96477